MPTLPFINCLPLVQPEVASRLAARCSLGQAAGTTEPLTHKMYWQSTRMNRGFVQVKKLGILYCALIVDAFTTSDGIDCWTVDTLAPESVRLTVAVKNVRPCGFDQCICLFPEDEVCSELASSSTHPHLQGGAL